MPHNGYYRTRDSKRMKARKMEGKHEMPNEMMMGDKEIKVEKNKKQNG